LNIIRVLCFDSSPRLVAMISTGHVVDCRFVPL
jgi:hypothetical protein